MSFVFSEDVTDLIVKLINRIAQNTLQKEILNKSFNLACEEAITTEELVHYIVCNI